MKKFLTLANPFGIALVVIFMAGVMPAISFAGEKVTALNFPRAESDMYLKNLSAQGEFGKFFHIRNPIAIDQQDVIRMNRDTLYSGGIFDLNTPLTIYKPDTGDRYQSMQVVNQDHYTKMVGYEPGEYTITKEEMGTRYVLITFRTLVDASDPGDIVKVNEIQDRITTTQASPGSLELPDWDKSSLDRVRDALNVLASTLDSAEGMFGDIDEVDPVRHLIGAAFGWGGFPSKDATYLNFFPALNDGKTAYTVTLKDVPVDGFWSISVYNNDGFFEQNDYDAYSVNNLTAETDENGSVTVHFGGDPKRPNYLPITEGWNYIARLYQPRQEVLDGEWTFPEPEQVE